MSMERIRLVKFLNVFAIGGTERQFVNIVKRLDPEQFDLRIACFRKWGAFLPEIEACHRPLTAFQIRNMHSPTTMWRQLQFARYLRHYRTQVLHTYGWYANVFGIPAAKLAGVPVIIASIRDTGAHQTPIQLKVQRRLCGLAHCVLANSDAVRDWLLAGGYRASQLRVIRNGIVQQKLDRSVARSSFRQELGIPSGAPLVGTVCRLNPVKAVEDLLFAAVRVLPSHPETRFVIIGDGDERAALTSLAAQLGIADRVIFLGFRTDVVQLLPQLTVSVLTSLTEGFSNTILESMAAGIPVVATRVGGNSEIIVDGVTGRLVPVRDTAALSDAIASLLGNPELAIRMGSSGKSRVAGRFSIENTVRETEQLYLELMEKCPIAA
jgi:glycosyltransferase involved in cell wall biosynthesis